MKPIQTNTPENEDTGEFAVFDSLDAIAAYVHHKLGEEALRELFARFVSDDGGLLKEGLLDTAAELEHRGLDKPAAVLYEIAESAPSGMDMVPDYMVNAGPDWVPSWRRSWITRRQIKLGLWDKGEGQKEADKGPPLESYKRVKPLKRAQVKARS